jgi:hypothetical protein
MLVRETVRRAVLVVVLEVRVAQMALLVLALQAATMVELLLLMALHFALAAVVEALVRSVVVRAV